MATGNRKTPKTAPSTPAGGKAAPASNINWAGVKKAYCTTHQSTRAIGTQFGVSHTMVAKRAAAQGWERPAKPEKEPAEPKSRARATRPPAAAPAPVVAEGLDARQQRFVDEYLVDLNGTQAYMRAVPGTADRTAQVMAARWLGRVEIQAAIQAGRAAMQARTQITADKLLLQAAQIVMADPRELIETKVGCCRHCWGIDFKRQRTQVQRDADFEAWRKKAKPEEVFDEEGGTGFNPHLPPNPDCIECCGDGVSRDVIKDSRYLSPAAAQLYAGVKRTRHGIEVLMHDKATFAEKLWRHLGLYEKDNGQRNDPLALRSMTDTERAVRLSAVLQGSPELLALFSQLPSGEEPA